MRSRAARGRRSRTAASTARWSLSARCGSATSHTSGPASACRSISVRVSRSDRVVAASSTWKRSSAARRSTGPDAAAQPLDVLLQALEVRRRGPVGRQLRHGGRHGGPVVGEVAQLVDAERAEPVEQATVRRPAHERPAVASPPRLHEPGPAQAGERLAQRDRRHAELGGEVALRRQLVALAEDAPRRSRPQAGARPPPRAPRSRAGRARCAGCWKGGGSATSGSRS